MVANDIIFNNDLSRDARLLYMMIQAKITIPDYTLYKTTLIKLFGANEKTFDRYWKELKAKGYLIQYKFRDEDNKYYYEYELLDEPNIELASKVHFENNAPKQDEKSCENPDPTFWGGGSLEGWETGVYNNTDTSNTDLNNIEFNNSNNNTTTRNTKKDSKESVVVDTTNKDLIESKSNLALTPYQSKTVSKWSEEKLHRALEIYNLNDGQTFALLLKIYKAGAINNLTNTNITIPGTGSVSSKIASYNKIPSHDWDFDEIERLERQYIERKLSGANGEYEK